MQIELESNFINNLENICDYIEFHLLAYKAANRLFEKVIKEVQRLEDAPRTHMIVENSKNIIPCRKPTKNGM